jgi:uncharacterized protein
MKLIDLSDAPVVDAHCHPFVLGSLAGAEESDWTDRITMMGMCFVSSGGTDPTVRAAVSRYAGDTLFARAGRRWLGEFLGSSSDAVAVRKQKLDQDPHGYIRSLLKSEHIVGLFVDEGYPQPTIDLDQFGRLVGTEIHKVVRIEPLIDQARDATDNARDLEDAFCAMLEASDGVAFKSVIAYRTGLDIGTPSSADVDASYRRWHDAEWRDDRTTSKDLRDRLVGVTLDVARKVDKPVHIHSGGGDPDVVLSHARPSLLAPLLRRYAAQPIVLIHGGYPWVNEAAYLATIFPLAFIEMSLTIPWMTIGARRDVETLVGSVSTSKILYGTDESSEPEVFWLGARIGRRILEQVLADAVHDDYLTQHEAENVGRDILARNVLRLHGIDQTAPDSGIAVAASA